MQRDNVVDGFQSPVKSFYEFFAGAGLARIGLAPWFSPIWANDIDPKKADIYIENFGPQGFCLDDIANIKSQHLPGQAALAWASFPCQDLSLAGWRRGLGGDKSSTFWAFWTLMRDLGSRKPPIIVLENVIGLLHASGDLEQIVNAFSSIQMRIGAAVIDALNFVPQSRQRIFLIAIDNHIPIERFNEPIPESSRWFPPAVWRVFKQLPVALQDEWVWWSLPQRVESVSPSLSCIIEHEPNSVQWHTEQQTRTLIDMMSPLHVTRVEEARRCNSRQIGFVYKRRRNNVQRAEVRFDAAGCLRAPSGGSSRQIVMIVENGAVRTRLMSPREAARLMGAPESFVLPSRYNQAYQAMGEAVVVPVVHWLAKNLISPLSEIAEQSALHRF